MKIQGQKYETMLAAMRAVVEHHGVKPLREHFASLTRRRMLWDVWRVAHNNILYADSHPGFANGTWTRITPHVPEFDVYSDDTHDTHIETALKKIALHLGLIHASETMTEKETDHK